MVNLMYNVVFIKIQEMTLESLEEFDDKETKLYEEFNLKLCMCDCQTCSVKSPHNQSNCFHECENSTEVW